MSSIPNAITAVLGVRVGHYTSPHRPTGCTVVLVEEGATGGVDVRGAAPGTRETDLLSPENVVEKVHAVLLTGGSAFGLDAAGGVMEYLEKRGVGVKVGRATVPIVPAAVIFDLWFGDISLRPDAEAGYAACEAATASAPLQGSVGAGAGASVGKFYGITRAMKGGVGTAARKLGHITVGALVVVNAIGDIIDPRTGRIIAGARTEDGRGLANSVEAIMRGEAARHFQLGANTTIGVIATDAILTKAQAQRIATAAHDGVARAINPAHTMGDGDTLFTVATGKSGLQANMTVLGTAAAVVMAEAILNAVRSATGLPELPSYTEFWQETQPAAQQQQQH